MRLHQLRGHKVTLWKGNQALMNALTLNVSTKALKQWRFSIFQKIKICPILGVEYFKQQCWMCLKGLWVIEMFLFFFFFSINVLYKSLFERTFKQCCWQWLTNSLTGTVFSSEVWTLSTLMPWTRCMTIEEFVMVGHNTFPLSFFYFLYKSYPFSQ